LKGKTYNIKEIIMSGKYMKTINPELTAQIEEGISSNQYLNEGIQLVNEAF
jgi:hypothetical protein